MTGFATTAAFRSAVNGVFDVSHDLASEFVTELGNLGLAIAGEAMKSGRHALGTVGIVGAVGVQKSMGAFKHIVVAAGVAEGV